MPTTICVMVPIILRGKKPSKNTEEEESVHMEESSNKVEEPIPDTLRFRTTKESELDMNFF
jgi:hypothetical protein